MPIVVTLTIAKVIFKMGDDKKYCSSCCFYKNFSTGKIVQTANRKIKRFKCFECLNRASEQKFKSKVAVHES
jgi:hypothetical protein